MRKFLACRLGLLSLLLALPLSAQEARSGRLRSFTLRAAIAHQPEKEQKATFMALKAFSVSSADSLDHAFDNIADQLELSQPPWSEEQAFRLNSETPTSRAHIPSARNYVVRFHGFYSWLKNNQEIVDQLLRKVDPEVEAVLEFVPNMNDSYVRILAKDKLKGEKVVAQVPVVWESDVSEKGFTIDSWSLLQGLRNFSIAHARKPPTNRSEEDLAPKGGLHNALATE